MSQTKDLGRLFFHLIRVRPKTPLVHRAVSVEIEPPYRYARPFVLRLPRGWALVAGWWQETGWDVDTALLAAVAGWGIDPFDDNLDRPEVRQTIRENLAASGMDLDDEWQIISALGLD